MRGTGMRACNTGREKLRTPMVMSRGRSGDMGRWPGGRSKKMVEMLIMGKMGWVKNFNRGRTFLPRKTKKED